MASITLDPRLLAPPDSSADADAFRTYVTRLSGWRDFAKERGCTITVSRDAQEMLAADGAYPVAASLRDDLKLKLIEDYDFQTLKVFCEGFFQIQPCFQEFVGVTEVLHDTATFAPEIAESPRLPNTSIEAKKNLVTLAILDQCHCQSRKPCFALHTETHGPQLAVSAHLHDIEHKRSELGALINLPQHIRGNVTVCSSLEDFAISFDAGVLFQHAMSDDQMRLCIRLAIYRSRLQRNCYPTWDELPEIQFGSEFRDRAQRIGPLKTGLPSNILDCIVNIYEGISDKLTHPLRTGPGGGAPQITSGTFDAWRRDIAGDVHLHYWIGTKGLIELSWISHPHDDFYISQPSGN